MGNLTYLVDTDNQIKAATLGSSTADANYPLANVKALPISKPFRFTGKTSENITIDLLSAKTIDCVALLNSNLTTGCTITLNAGAASNPDGTTWTTTITWRQYDSFKIFTPVSYRYWKVIVANAGNPASYIQIGYLILGDSTTLSFNYSPGWTVSDEHANLELETEYGTTHVAELFSRVRLQLPFRGLSETDANTIRTLQRTLKRSLIPIFIAPDSAGTDAYFMRSVSNLNTQVEFYRDLDLEFLEEARGSTIIA